MKVNLEDNINSLNLKKDIENKLKLHEIKSLNELWQSSRNDLRKCDLSNRDISEIIIKLQLLGLDLNKKLYS